MSVVLATLLGLAGCGSGHATSSRTLHFTASCDQEKVVESAPAGPSLGDHQAFSGTLRDDAGAAAGQFGGTCTWVGVYADHVLEHCSSWADIGGDLVVSAGSSRDDAGDLTWAVTGGTGAYVGAAGEVRIRQVPAGLDVTFALSVPDPGG